MFQETSHKFTNWLQMTKHAVCFKYYW